MLTPTKFRLSPDEYYKAVDELVAAKRAAFDKVDGAKKERVRELMGPYNDRYKPKFSKTSDGEAYTNRKPTAVVNDTSNTDEQHMSQQSVPGAKLQKVSEYDKEETEKNFDAAKRYQKVSPVFYSNAERAVEGVKQGKANGEQWLAMIQKNGGLKAGEDKWLGLSDWLHERKGKSVTKEEVLDFIRKNQVEVEEVRYSAVRDFNKYGKVDSTTVNLSVFTKHLKWLCSCS